MVDSAMFLVWTALGVLVGWLTAQCMRGYRLRDELLGGVVGSTIGGAVAHTLFRDALGGPLGSVAFGVALTAALVVLVRMLPDQNLT